MTLPPIHSFLVLNAMDFSGTDLLDYITDILQDLQHLGSIDLMGLGFRVLVLFFGAVVFVVLSKFLFRVFWDVFGGVVRFVWRLVSAPYVIPREKLRSYQHKRRWSKLQQQKQAEREESERLYQQREKEEKTRLQQELDAFDKIMKK